MVDTSSQEKRAHDETYLIGTFMLGSLASRSLRNKFLLVKPPGLLFIAVDAQGDYHISYDQLPRTYKIMNILHVL